VRGSQVPRELTVAECADPAETPAFRATARSESAVAPQIAVVVGGTRGLA
jgi:hypothetical protein